MRDIIYDSSGLFSAETAIVISVVCMILTAGILFYIGIFNGVNVLCSSADAYTGPMPSEIHRITTVIIETGGELIEKIL